MIRRQLDAPVLLREALDDDVREVSLGSRVPSPQVSRSRRRLGSTM